jgi:hypothetical protein
MVDFGTSCWSQLGLFEFELLLRPLDFVLGLHIVLNLETIAGCIRSPSCSAIGFTFDFSDERHLLLLAKFVTMLKILQQLVEIAISSSVDVSQHAGS